MKDSDNPMYMFSMMSDEMVHRIAIGEIDAKEYAKREMENRGIGINGTWIGFEQSRKEWKSNINQM